MLKKNEKYETYIDKKAWKGQDVIVYHKPYLPGAFIAAESEDGIPLYPDNEYSSLTGEVIGIKWYEFK